MKVSIVLDKRNRKKDGTYPVKIRVSEGKRQVYINTSVSVESCQFVSESERVVGCRLERVYNEKLQTMKARITEKALKLEIVGKGIDSIRGEIEQDITDDESELFRNVLCEHLGTLSNERTHGVYNQTVVRLKKWLGDSYDSLCIKNIDKKWLEAYCSHLRGRGVKDNTISIDCRNIRTLYNRAIDCGYADANSYPFRSFRIPHQKTRKRSLTIEQLRRLIDAPLKGNMAKYRDLFMLSFYLCGMNMVDILNLESVSSGVIDTLRTKTGQPIHFTIQPEAMEIFGRYSGKRFALDVMDSYSDHLDFVRLMSRGLKRAGDRNGVICSEISVYWARHTWATIASYLDVPERTIATALSHADNSVTGIYINFDTRKVDDANRKVIDYVLGR